MILIPESGPDLWHIGASVGRQSLGRGVYGNSAPTRSGPSDINPLVGNVHSAGLCLEKETKKNKTKHSHAARAKGMNGCEWIVSIWTDGNFVFVAIKNITINDENLYCYNN